MSDWRSLWEDASSKEESRWKRASDHQLLAAVRSRSTGEYYGLWRELGSRRPSAEVCWVLFDVLESDREYLERYHCADALLKLLNIDALEAVALSAGWPEEPANLARVRGVIESRFGPRA